MRVYRDLLGHLVLPVFFCRSSRPCAIWRARGVPRASRVHSATPRRWHDVDDAMPPFANRRGGRNNRKASGYYPAKRTSWRGAGLMVGDRVNRYAKDVETL